MTTATRRVLLLLICTTGLLVVCCMLAVAQANAAPTAAFNAWRVDASDPFTVRFDASASSDSDGAIVLAQWVFGDGTTGAGPTPTHTYTDTGPFPVTLLVTDNQGATALVVQQVDLSMLIVEASGGQGAAATVASTAPVGTDIGYRAPEISLPDETGAIVNLSDFLGYTVVIDFWRSTCSGCKSTVPYLDSLIVRYGSDELVVLLVALDANLDTALTYMATRSYTRFVVVHEGNTGVKTTYGVTSIPWIVLVDPTGVIRYIGGASGLTDILIEAWL